METSHEIFVEREHRWEKKQFSVQDMIKSISYPKWAEKTIETYGESIKDLYILLVCFPWWSSEQRNIYISQYKEQILDARNTIDVEYMNDLYVTIWHNWTATHYIPEEFISIRNDMIKEFNVHIEQLA